MKKCSECVCYGACVILSKFINSFSEEKNELSPCVNFRPYDPREQITAKWETDEEAKFPRCSHCGEHSFRREKYCPNCRARMKGEKEASPKPTSDYIERSKVYEMLNAIGGCGAEPESWADGFDKAIDTAISELSEIPAADVAPVKHGRWMNYVIVAICSECGTKSAEGLEPPYCPQYGAKMDGECSE